jgi:WG containing repeat
MCDNFAGNAIISQADGKRVVLSRTGDTWIDIGAERVGINIDDGLVTFLKNGKWGLVDTAGQVVVEPQFDEPTFFLQALRGVAWAKREGNWYAIDRRGHPVPGIARADANPLGRPINPFECKVEP